MNYNPGEQYKYMTNIRQARGRQDTYAILIYLKNEFHSALIQACMIISQLGSTKKDS